MKQNNAKARVKILHPHSAIIYNAIRLEKPANPERSKINIQFDRKASRITLNFEATDFNALRASLLSYLRWIKLVEDIIEIFKELK